MTELINLWLLSVQNASVIFFLSFLLIDRSIRRTYNCRVVLRVWILYPLHGYATYVPMDVSYIVLPRQFPQSTAHGIRLRSNGLEMWRVLLSLQKANAIPQRDGNSRHKRRKQPHLDHWYRCFNAFVNCQCSLV